MASPTIKPKKISFLPMRSSVQQKQSQGEAQEAQQQGQTRPAVNCGGIFTFLRVFRLANMMTQTGC